MRLRSSRADHIKAAAGNVRLIEIQKQKADENKRINSR